MTLHYHQKIVKNSLNVSINTVIYIIVKLNKTESVYDS